jgi:hypothetical protein
MGFTILFDLSCHCLARSVGHSNLLFGAPLFYSFLLKLAASRQPGFLRPARPIAL